ncbi:ABC transporter permease [Seohaeicola saemankumensis]|nr:ABC transporter permease [Seohaeicola saemankumensis]MCA0869360.1 ABC transporter permease [Seohaeicola saemankumensis]
MAKSPAPFAPFEWIIAWRYLRARRAEGGVSVMTWISLIGIALAVFALVSTLAIREGLRADFIKQMLGANAHVEVHMRPQVTDGRLGDHLIRDYADVADRLEAMEGVIDAAPLVRAQVMGSFRGRNAPVDVYGITLDDLMDYPLVADPETATGDLARLNDGVALGSALARQLSVGVGDRVKFISPDGVKTALGTSPRISAYEVVYVFSFDQGLIDRTRAYLPLSEAQSFFNKEGGVDQIDVLVREPETVQTMVAPIEAAAGPRAYAWTWQDRFGDMLRALKLQDNAIFVVLAILVLIAALNIVSGLIMLVKNKGRDIGILRTVGLSEGSVLRVFFLCGALVGTCGTILGVILGIVFSLNIESVYALVNTLSGDGVQRLEANGFIFPSAKLTVGDVAASAGLSIALSWLITFFPARRAARMNPVEALRYE